MNELLKYEAQNLCEIVEMSFINVIRKNVIVHKSYYSRILRMITDNSCAIKTRLSC